MIISKLIGQKSKDGWSHMVADEDLSVVVDCGQRARYKTLKQIKKAECIVLTHSHADHVKNIGKILEMEYKGEVICTKETYNNMVKVYGDIIVKNKDIFKLLDYGEEYTVKGNKTVKLRDAGHCLGSAIVELNMGKDKKVVITGDVEANVDDEVCRLNDINSLSMA